MMSNDNRSKSNNLGYDPNHRVDEPTRLYVDDLDIVKQAAVDRAVRLFRYPETDMWAVSLRSAKHSYEVRKPVYVSHNEHTRFEVYCDGRRMAT
jgi:hypothetical protein